MVSELSLVIYFEWLSLCRAKIDNKNMAAVLLLFVLVLSYNCHPQLEVLASATPSDHDFSYMKSVHDATDLPSEEEYDYIVIGGGTAGCPLAATLSKKYSVLVLERGSAPVSYPRVLDANGLLANLLEEDNGSTPAQRFTSEDGVASARGRVLGGSSMINFGFYSRADQDFYKESGIHWDMDMVDKAYKWVEDTIMFHSNLSVFQSIFRDALLEAGVGPDNGFNLNHVVGTKASGSTFDGQGRRHGAVELLNRGVMKNLRVAVEAYVDKIIFSSNITSRLSAKGVIYTDSKGKIHRAFVRDKGEVILSAGAIGSPQLLLLNGIGPNSYLSSLRIPVVHQNLDVGNFMADNPRHNIFIVVPFALDASIAQVAGITSDKNIIEAISFNSQFSFPSPFGLFPNSASSLNFSIAMIYEKFLGPLSSGSLRLVSSSDVRVNPLVRFNYFADAVDLARCVRGMRKVGDLLKTDSMEPLKFQDLEGTEGFKYLGPSLPKGYENNDASMETFCRNTVTTFWHYHGGCVVGKVVDGDFRVIGTNSLRVVDGSTFNTSPGTNPQATLMMIGRYIGLKILQERRAAK